MTRSISICGRATLSQPEPPQFDEPWQARRWLGRWHWCRQAASRLPNGQQAWVLRSSRPMQQAIEMTGRPTTIMCWTPWSSWSLRNRWLRGMFWLPGMRNTSRAFGAQVRNVTPPSTSVAPMGVSRLTLSLWPSISPPFPLRRFLQVSESSSGLMFSTGRQLNLAMPIDYLSWGKPGYHMIPAWHRRSRR